MNFKGNELGAKEMPPKGKHIFGAVTVGEKGQIVIPVKARRIFGIKPGDDLILLGDEDRGLALMHSDFLFGCLKKLEEKEDE